MLKRLKNIEDRVDNQLRPIEGQRNNQGKDSDCKSTFDGFKQQLPPEALAMLNRIQEKKLINYSKLNLRGGDNEFYDFSDFTKVGELFNRIYYGEILIPEAEREQEAFDYEFERLRGYRSRESGRFYILKEDLEKNSKHFKDAREILIKAFKDKLFPLSDPKYYPQYTEESSGSEESSDTEELL